MSSPTNEELELMGLLLYKSNLYQKLSKHEVELTSQECDADLKLFARAVSDARLAEERENRKLRIEIIAKEEEITALERRLEGAIFPRETGAADMAKASVRALAYEMEEMRDKLSSIQSDLEEDSCCGGCYRCR